MRTPPPHPSITAALSTYPPAIRKKILTLRSLIYEIANSTEGVGAIEETLKWGEPSFAPKNPKSGTAIRLAWHKKTPDQFGLYVHCGTNLIPTFKKKYPSKFKYDKTRGIIFSKTSTVSSKEIRAFITNALTYYKT